MGDIGEWEASYDGISHDLVYHADDKEVWTVLVKTIARLPEEVRRFALDRCQYISAGRGAWAYVIPLPTLGTTADESKSHWLVVIDETTPAKELQCAIAHEIAHAWRGDIGRDAKDTEAMERATALLVKEWGFEGAGADPDHPQKSKET